MKQGRKALCLVLTVILALSTVLGSVTVSAAKAAKVKVGSKFVSGACQYQVLTLNGKKGTAALAGTKSKTVKAVQVPETVKCGNYKFTVVEIGNNAFKNCKKLQSVKTNKALAAIGKNAFNGCTKLGTVTVNSSKLKKVGANALKGVKKITLLVPKGKEGAYAKIFKGKGQKKTEIPALAGPAKATAEKAAKEGDVPAAAATLQAVAATQGTPVVTTPQTEAEVQKTPAVAAPQTEAQGQKALGTAAPQADVKAQDPAGSGQGTDQAMEKKTPDTAADESETVQQETAHVHTGEWAVKAQASCKGPGMKERVCEECGAIEREVIPATLNDHVLVSLPDVEPTCEGWGKHSVKKCEACGQVFFDVTGMEPLGHEFSGQYTQDVAPTGTTPGWESKHCMRDGCTATTEGREVPATGETESETETEPVHEHTFPDAWTLTVEPTCITTGEEERARETCGETETRQIPADPSKHKRIEGLPTRIEPTCTTWGKDKYWKCEACGQEFFDLAGMEPLGHNFPEGQYTMDKEAACTAPGVESIHCTNPGCNATAGAREIEAKGHTWGDAEVTPATCTAPGYTKHACTVCGAEEAIGRVEATGHSWKEEVAEAATCEHAGSKVEKCEYCQEQRNQEVIPMLPHTLDGQDVQHPSAHCYEKGTVTQRCSACGQDIVVGEMGYGEHHYDEGGNVCKDCGLSKDDKYDFSGYIWFVTYKANLAECVGFNGNGTGDTRAKTVRGDVPICVGAPTAVSGYHFAGWKITANGTVKTFETTDPGRVDTYEKVLRELGILPDVGPRQCPNQITIEAIYEADFAA